MAEAFQTQTVTPNGSQEAINWPTKEDDFEVWDLYVSTNSEPVEVVDDVSATTGITVPANETNYPVESWRIASDGRPSHVYCANNAGNVKLTLVRVE